MYEDDSDTPEPKGGRAKKRAAKADADIAREAIECYDRWFEREQRNVDEAYEDLCFSRKGEQWPESERLKREAQGRPALTINKVPQFVRQVTGDIRMSRPGIKVVPVDDMADKETAKVLAGLIRYIENRSEAQAAYYLGCDAQVTCGIGAWQIATEYAGNSTLNQEIRIKQVDDAVAIAWDPDSRDVCRADADWCIVPFDVSHEAFERDYPEASLEDFDDRSNIPSGWFGADFVRVAVYWCRKEVEHSFAVYRNGAIVDLDVMSVEELGRLPPPVKVEKRKTHEIWRYEVTARQVLKKAKWPGRYIPIVPVIGEECQIGREVYRNGLVRWMKEPQRIYNYAYSTNVELGALQPKAPFLVTAGNIKGFEAEWLRANVSHLPFLRYTPDGANGNAAPQRVQPPVSSPHHEMLQRSASEDMKAVSGIYDASLGNRSNETSGRAILARQREGDVSTVCYLENFAAAIRHTARILVDLIPHIYDTERTLRILGEDGKPEEATINRQVGLSIDPDTYEIMPQLENDLSIGSYDVVLETGPSYSTRREEAREGMTELLRALPPDAVPLVADLIAKMQDWPMADELGERFEELLPPAIKAKLAEKRQGDAGAPGQGPPQPGMPGQPPGEPPPDPMQQQAIALEFQLKQAELAKAVAEAEAAQQRTRQAAAQADEAEAKAQQARLALIQGRMDVLMPPEPSPTTTPQ
jgi:hypothetical protein